MSVETLKVPERANIEFAQEVLSQAVSLESGHTIALEADEVKSIDGSVVMALANIAEKMAERQTPMQAIRPAPAFLDAFNDLGLYGQLMKMEFKK